MRGRNKVPKWTFIVFHKLKSIKLLEGVRLLGPKVAFMSNVQQQRSVLERKTVLVSGGAGYIGSLTALMLLDRGSDVVIIDNLSSGSPELVKEEKLIIGNIGDPNTLEKVFSSRKKIDGVIHFAGSVDVEESFKKPDFYFQNNIGETNSLLNFLSSREPIPFIFSSTAAVYGKPKKIPIDEDHPKSPLSPYASSKLIVEEMLSEFQLTHGLNFISLRYFNAAGADPQGRLGDIRQNATHLIPRIFEVASGKRSELPVFGKKYDTLDGTAERDFIHITDLAAAHLKALERLWNGGQGGFYNLGTGRGHTVLEVVAKAEKVTNRKIPYSFKPSRKGDSPSVIADNRKAVKDLEWKPVYSDMETILKHSWLWYESGPMNNIPKKGVPPRK